LIVAVNTHDYPDFETAERRFQAFLQSLGRHGRIHWVFPEDGVCLNRILYLRGREESATRAEAAREYERARAGGLPVELSTLGYGNRETFAFIFSPHDRKEAQKSLLSEGLKLSAVSGDPTCRVIRNRLLWALLWWLGQRKRPYVNFLFHREVGLVARKMDISKQEDKKGHRLR
jgi:hypothetical protein